MSMPRRIPVPFLAVLVPYLGLVARFSFVTDDAFISFRYSRNLAAGLGLRYNVGVEPPVEGFSNLLWVLWLAVFERFGLDVTFWSRATSIACGVVLLWRVARLVRERVTGDPLAIGCALLFLVTLPPYALWSTSGLATMPFTLVVFLAFESLLGDAERPRPWRTALLFLVLLLLRADGPVFVALLLTAAGLRWLLGGRPPALVRAAGIATGTFVLGLAGFLAWRYAYFGDVAPNTAHAKVGLSLAGLRQGTDYVVVYLLTFLSLPLLLAASLGGVRSREPGLVLPALVLALGTFAYAIAVGGDFMAMHRFLTPALPFLAVVLAAALQRWAPAGRAVQLGATLVLVVLSLLPGWDVHLVPASVRQHFHFRLRGKFESEYARWVEQVENTEKWSLMGRVLARHTQPGESLVAGRIGAIGYYSGLFIHDRKGLVDRDVAREVPPEDEASPGHGKTAPLSFFFDETGPTYMHALFFPTDEAEDLAWFRFNKLFREREEDELLIPYYESVLIPLGPEDGAGDGVSLWLAKRRDADPEAPR